MMGNHEHYYGNFTTTESIIRAYLPDNIRLLQNESVHYGGVHWIGATMWTDFNNGSGVIMEQACRGWFSGGELATGMLESNASVEANDEVYCIETESATKKKT